MRIKKMIFVICIFCVFITMGGNIKGDELNGREIVNKSRILGRVEDIKSQIEMKIVHSSGQVRMRKMNFYSLENKEGVEKVLIQFLEPADIQGSGYLNIMHPDKLDEKHLYLPALGRTRRISSKERGSSFMGSDFSYEDISPDMDDYDYKLLGVEEIEGIPMFLVSSTPVSDQVQDDVGFAQEKMWIHKDNFVLVQSIKFNEYGEELKIMNSEKIQEIKDDLWIATKLVMKDLIEGSRTELIYENIEIDTGITDNFFSIRQLTRPIF